MRVGYSDVLFIKTLAEDFSAEPAIGLELAQVVEQTAQGVMGRGAGSIHGSLSGNRIAIFRLYNYTAMKSPGGADDFDGQHFARLCRRG